MKNGITFASLLFLLASPAMSAAAPGNGKSVAPLTALTVGHAPQMAVRAPKKGGGGGSSGGSDDDDSSNFDFSDDDSSSGGSSGSSDIQTESCFDGSSCSDCFGPGYQACEGSDSYCYNPDIPESEEICSTPGLGAGSNLNPRNSFMAGAAIALGMTAAML